MKLAIIAIIALALAIAVDAHHHHHHHHEHEEDESIATTSVAVLNDEGTPKSVGYGAIGSRKRRGWFSTFAVGQMFCELYKYSTEKKYGPTKLKSVIMNKFPNKWHNHLIGRLVYRGILALVDTSAKLCGVEESVANRYLQNAKITEPTYDLELEDACLNPK